MSSEHKDMFFNIQNLYNFVVANIFAHRGGVEPARSLVFRLLSRRAKTTTAFKQSFSSPSLVLKLGENFVIEMQFPAQWFRKEQLEIISHNKTQAVTASVSEAVQFCHINNKNFSGLLRRIAPRNDEGKNSHEQSGGKCIPSPRGRAREGVKLC